MGTHLLIEGSPMGTEPTRHLAQSGHDVIVGTRSGAGPDNADMRAASVAISDARDRLAIRSLTDRGNHQ
jgi:uncharacterized protein YbjT (DUF2867 family)